MGAVPGVDFALQAVALGQQFAVARREVAHQGSEASPELVGRQAAAGQRLVFDETVQGGRHLQAMMRDAFSHAGLAS
ncbi:Uncharacterised protein [Bordetella pertussis]|nr:Uncharacterised protein [Bordetella pertussis]CFT87167.1 Uncharacterised protein [Bordetella pertussis]